MRSLNYLIVDANGEPYNGVFVSVDSAETIQKRVNDLLEKGVAGDELIDELENFGIKYIHLEDTYIIIQ